MALVTTGTRLTAQGASTYINQMNRAGAATTAFSVAVGNLISQAAMALPRMLANSARAAVDAFSEFERLSMSMESLIAREIRTEDATIGMNDALQMAAPRAQELLGWIEQLAITSPFDMAGVAAAFRTAQAYGFTAAEAQRLTQVTIDFASATGATTQTMNQISLALGQIRAKGKLAGQEILQLVNAGINVNAILQGMGYTLDDVSNGLVDANSFIAAFVDTMDADFGGAAARATDSLTGLRNTLGDLQQIGLRELFGPVFEAALPALSAFVDKLRELMPLINFFGQGLASVTRFVIENRQQIITTVAALTTFIGGFILVAKAGAIMTAATTLATGAIAALGAAISFLLSPIGLVAAAIGGLAALFVFSFSDIRAKTGDFFGNMSNDLFGFGRDLIVAFAEGMAQALVYVIDVLTQLGQIIAYWLAPGSPPRLLPQIDVWGKDAMNEYLGGFTQADFGIFNTLSRTISSFIRSLDIKQKNIIPNIIGSRAAIGQALTMIRETGRVTEEAIQRIISNIKDVNPEMEGYIRALFKSAEAQERLKAAQERLNEVQERYKALLKPLNAELDQIAKRRQQIIDDQRKAELESILADESAPELAKELAQMELREMELKSQIATTEDAQAAEEEKAQAAVDGAQAAADAAAQELALKQELIDAQIEQNNLIKQQLELLRGMGGGAAGAGGAGGRGGAGLPGGGLLDTLAGIPPLTSTISDALEGLKENLSGLLSDLTAPFSGIGEKLNELSDAWSNAFIAIGETVAAGVLSFSQNMLQVIAFINKTKETWRGNLELMMNIWGMWKNSVDKGIVSVSGYLLNLIAKVEELKEVWRGNFELILKIWGDFKKKVDSVVVSIAIKFLEFITKINDLKQSWVGNFELIKNAIGEVATFIDNLKAAFEQFKQWLDNNVLTINIELPDLPDWSIPGSPIPLHTAWKDFGDYIKSTPAFDLPLTSTGQSSVTNNIITNNVQGVGNASVNNGMDLAMLEALILRTVQRGVANG